jgi:hypothetical protein
MDTIKEFSPLDHIHNLTGDAERLIAAKEDFVAFIVLALGTEFLGSFYDADDFNKYGNSETRFKNALKNLFKNNWYNNNLTWMYEQFRGPLVHQYRMGPEIALTSVCKNNAPLDHHLKMEATKRIFILEQYFADFKAALKSLENLVEKKNNSLNKDKLEQEYMKIVQIEKDNKSYPASAVTQSIVIKKK